ncbi:hypothetical protein JB92DRAFT_3032462 [Gautieria morchelliformis]|nr:hypothetical protein JB92DRAFT_3032462 [Gautieria morchelliformis]
MSTTTQAVDRTPSFIDDDRPIFLANLREATSTPSPVSDILADPKMVRVLTRPMTPRRSSSRNSKPRKPTNDGTPELPLLSLVLNEEQRQSSQLRVLLRSTTDRLEYEMQRADEMRRRADYAENMVRQASERIANMVAAQHKTELTVAQLTEEVKRYRMRVEDMQGEVERAQADIDELEDKKRLVERDARQARELVNLYEKTLAEREAKETGRQEAMKHMGHRFVDGIVEGRNEGYETAKRTERARRKHISRAAFEAGRVEGFNEGSTQGRAQERRKAMEAFDKFLASQGYTEDENSVSSKSGSVSEMR